MAALAEPQTLPISTEELDQTMTTEEKATGIKRPASEPTPDSVIDAPAPKREKKQGTRNNWGHVYFENEANTYAATFTDRKQVDFVAGENGRRFSLAIPATKALTKFLRPGGNLGAYAWSDTEGKATVNTRLIFGTQEKLKTIHDSFRAYIEKLEEHAMKAMWENEEIKGFIYKQYASPISKKESEEEKETLAYKLFAQGFSRAIKPGDGDEWTLDVKSKAFYPEFAGSDKFRKQEVHYYNSEYEKMEEDYTIGNMAIISVVIRPSGYTTPGFGRYGLSLRLADEVVVYKELGSASSGAVSRETLQDLSRPFAIVPKTNKNSGAIKMYVKDESGSDFTVLSTERLKYAFKSNLGDFDGKITQAEAQYTGKFQPSQELVDLVRSVEKQACAALMNNEEVLATEKEKMQKLTEITGETFEEVFMNKFQSPINKERGDVQIGMKQFYENRDVKGQFDMQPFPSLEDAEGNAMEGEEKIEADSVVEVPITFNIYTLSSGVFGMSLKINNRYSMRVIEEAGFVKGAPPPPKFDF